MPNNVVYSVLKPAAVQKQARQHYAWPETTQVGLMHAGTDTVYLVFAPEGWRLLRLYSAHRQEDATCGI